MIKPKPKTLIKSPDSLIHVPQRLLSTIDQYMRVYGIRHPRTKSPRIQKEYVLFFANLIFLSGIKFKRADPRYDDTYAEISSTRLRQWDECAEIYMHFLDRSEFIDVRTYKIGINSKMYRLKPNTKIVPFHLTHKPLIKKIARLGKKNAEKTQSDQKLMIYFEAMKGVTVKPDAIVFVENSKFSDNYSELWKLNVIEKMDLSGDFWLHFGYKVNRIYTPFCSLKREVRKNCLLIDGEEMCELDIKCSQPSLLYVLLKNQNYATKFTVNYLSPNEKEKLESELIEYKCLFNEPNDFYRFILGEYLRLKPNKKLDRDKIKVFVLRWLFSKKNKDPIVTQIFNNEFPIMLKCITMFKEGGNSLAALLQNLEAEIVLDEVCGQLKDCGFSWFTVHDSINFPKSKTEIVENVWKKTLTKYSLPHFS